MKNMNSLLFLFRAMCVGALLLTPAALNAQDINNALQQLQQLGSSNGGSSSQGTASGGGSQRESMVSDQRSDEPRLRPVDHTPSSIEISMQARLNALLHIVVRQPNSMNPSVPGFGYPRNNQRQTIQNLRVNEQLRRDRVKNLQPGGNNQNSQLNGNNQNSQSSGDIQSLIQGGQKQTPSADASDKKDMEDSLKITALGGDIRQFGYELFSGIPTTFIPASDIPIPPQYVLGPGDNIKLQYYGSQSASLGLVVDREGVIELPKVGAIGVAGMTFVDARALIAEQVRQKMIGVTVSVTMGRLRAIRVFVLGDVNYPGSYIVSGLSTISHALYAAGGISKKGSLRHAQLKRKGKVVRELDLYQFLLKGDNRGDERLQPGDVIFIPPVGPVVGVAGQVTRPAIYELKNEKSVGEIVAMAGGTLPDADSGHLQVDRVSRAGNRLLLDLDLKKEGGKAGAHNGDIVMLYPFAGMEINRVSIVGEVERPGSYGIQSPMKLSDLIAAAGGLTEQAYLKSAEITRYSVVGGAVRESNYFEVSIADVLAGKEDANVPLQAHDTVTIRKISNWRPKANVQLTGEFMHPGIYPVEEGEHLSTLIARAGGFSDKAYLPGAVFMRESIRIEEERQLLKLQQQIEHDLGQKTSEVAALKDGSLRARGLSAIASGRKVLGQLQTLQATGRLIIRLKDAEALKGTAFDLTLRDGDRLHLPMKSEEIIVTGEVTNPTAFLFQKSFGRDDYIELAGGPNRFADDGRIFIIHADGMVESGKGWAEKKRISPGDTIVVPQDIDRFNILDSLLDWSRTIIQISTSVATLRVLGLI